LNTEAEESTLLGAVTQQWLVKTSWEDLATASEDKLRSLSKCYSEKYMWISDSVIIASSYELEAFSKSNYQSKPCV
jgi:hypothetical protein